MSADLHIIAFDPASIPVDAVRDYFNFDLLSYDDDDVEGMNAGLDEQDKNSNLIYGEGFNFIDDVWVGQVSWGKAGLLGDVDKFVPRSINNLYGFYEKRGWVVQVTEQNIPAIMVALNTKSYSVYETTRGERGERLRGFNRYRGIAEARAVKKFLTRNIGNFTFIDSW